MYGAEVVLLSVVSAVAASLILAWVLFAYYRRAGSRPPQAYVYYHNGHRIVKYGLNGGIVRIGRHHDNEIQLQNRSVSRFHAQIVANHNGSFAIRDLDSRNGLKIHYRPVTYSLINDGDTLFVGKVPMKFVALPADYTTFPETVETDMGESFRMIKRKRRAERFSAVQPVRFYTDATGWVSGQAGNISEEGMFIRTDRPQPMRTPLDIVAQKTPNGRWFKLTGEVVRSEREGIAIAFTDVDRQTKETLYQLGKTSVTNAKLH